MSASEVRESFVNSFNKNSFMDNDFSIVRSLIVRRQFQKKNLDRETPREVALTARQ